MNITEKLLAFLNVQTEAVGFPAVMLDMIAQSESIALQTVQQSQIERAYIDGSKVCRYSFRLTLKGRSNVTTNVASLQMIQTLDALAELFREMDDFPLDDSTVIEKAEASTPSIILREETGLVVYGVTINLTYKET